MQFPVGQEETETSAVTNHLFNRSTFAEFQRFNRPVSFIQSYNWFKVNGGAAAFIASELLSLQGFIDKQVIQVILL